MEVTFIYLLLGAVCVCALVGGVENEGLESLSFTRRRKLNVALHAQVAPVADQVVGSVITTDGLKAALKQRGDIGMVKTFYPFKYDRLFTANWDVVIIEGWFLMIHDFIQVVRSHSPNAIVLFFCLDPSFPGLEETITYDVDGFLTNSRSVEKKLLRSGLPVEYIMLAADHNLMSPAAAASKEIASNKSDTSEESEREGVVFIGAGGKMLEYKPELLSAVEAALPFGLQLYGMGWDQMESADVRAAWRGVLPRGDIAKTYASNQVVLASTIESQRAQGMVNNRVFEAMSCGALVLSDYSPALEEMAQGTVLFANSSAEVKEHLQWAMANPAKARQLGQAARQLVLRRHTWSHRAVQILGLVGSIRSDSRAAAGCCLRPNCPKMLWVEGQTAATHSDYRNVVKSAIKGKFCQQYRLELMAEAEFAHRLADKGETWLQTYEHVLVALTPLDSLHRLLVRPNSDINREGGVEALANRRVVKAKEKGFGRLQKWSAYVLGLQGDLISMARSGRVAGYANGGLDSFDTVLFRTHAEMELFRQSFDASTTASASVSQSDQSGRITAKISVDGDRDVNNIDNKNNKDNKDRSALKWGSPVGRQGPCAGGLRCEHLFSLDTELLFPGLASADTAAESDFMNKLEPADTSTGIGEKEVQGDVKDRKGRKEKDGGGSSNHGGWFVSVHKDSAAEGEEGEEGLEGEGGIEGGRAARTQLMKLRQQWQEAQHTKAAKILVVCFHAHPQHCTLEARRRQMPGVRDHQYLLLLVGGTWESWLQMPGEVVRTPRDGDYNNQFNHQNYENHQKQEQKREGDQEGDFVIGDQGDLSRIHLVKDGHSNAVEGLFRTSEHVYLMHGVVAYERTFSNGTVSVEVGASFDSTGAITGTATSESSSTSTGTIERERESSLNVPHTLHDVLWPLVLAAQAQKANPLGGVPAHARPRLHLATPTPLLMAAAGGGVRGWDGNRLVQGVRRAVCKAHALGSGVTQLGARAMGIVQHNGISSSPTSSSSFDADAYAATSVRVGLVVELVTTNFTLGRDGDCCFQVELGSAVRGGSSSSENRENRGSSAGSESDYESKSDSVGVDVHYDFSPAALLDDEMRTNRTCLLRADHPALVLDVHFLTDGLVQKLTQSSAAGLAGIDSATAVAAAVEEEIRKASLLVYLRGSVFGDKVLQVRLPLGSFLDRGRQGADEVMERMLRDGEGMVRLERVEEVKSLTLNVTM